MAKLIFRVNMILEALSSKQRLILGLLMLLIVDLIWVGSSELTEVGRHHIFLRALVSTSG